MRNILIFVTFFMSFAGVALAESPLDPRRAIVHRDSDFPGGDIQSIFDTTRESCETACFTRQGCAAYTYTKPDLCKIWVNLQGAFRPSAMSVLHSSTAQVKALL